MSSLCGKREDDIVGRFVDVCFLSTTGKESKKHNRYTRSGGITKVLCLADMLSTKKRGRAQLCAHLLGKGEGRGKREIKRSAKYEVLQCSWRAMVAAGKTRGFSILACSSCLLLLQHNATALLLHRPGGAASSPGVRRDFLGRGMPRSWCGVQQWRERTSTSRPCHGGGGGIQRTTMVFDFLDQRARSQVLSLLYTAVEILEKNCISVKDRRMERCGAMW